MPAPSTARRQTILPLLLSLAALLNGAHAHVAAWHKGMYCLNGTQPGVDDQNTNDIVNPLFNLTKTDWWFHHYDGCDQLPPADGDFLDLPANGEFTVELAVNRAFTTLSFGGANVGVFPDGQNYTNGLGGLDCISDPNIHTQNQSMAAGSAFAISYTSNLQDVTPENLVVFTTLYHTPWHRLATYQVPNLPACPDAGCMCAVRRISRLWSHIRRLKTRSGAGSQTGVENRTSTCKARRPSIPNGPLINYTLRTNAGFRCRVTGSTGSAAVAPGIPATWCQDNPGNCTSGARQMIYWNQLDGNNIEVDGLDLAGQPRSPAYNQVLGFVEGRQTDIFLKDGTASPTSVAGGATPTLTGEPAGPTQGGGAYSTYGAMTSQLWWFMLGVAFVGYVCL
ncbi:unnamed protein product [Mycena citricolor]|uniref:Uncharacterized protein n=1 Tax=Mycena citricolor TaxID=2018698 RepID=A0AAD2HB04_9AGAR|nr:unnamed protein product [Mycena citricolor]